MTSARRDVTITRSIRTAWQIGEARGEWERERDGLKRTGNYLNAAACMTVALVMLGLEVAITVHIITQLLAPGGLSPLVWLDLIFGLFGALFGLMVVFINVLIGAAGVALIARERGIRAAAAHDDRGAPPATFQPDAALALRSAETLELVRTKRGGGIGQIVKTLFGVLILVLFLELAVALMLPAVNPLSRLDALVPFGIATPPPAPTLLDWVTLAYPLAFCLSLLVALVPTSLIGRRQRILADDQGITLDVSGRGRRFIPWNDMLVFARPADNKSASPTGGYLLWGREHGFALQFGMEKIRSRDPKLSVRQQDIFTFEGGYEAYEANAWRLLATVTARSGVPLRTFAGNTALLRKMNRRFPVLTMELEDVLAAPEADASWQPSPEAFAAVRRFDAAATLRERIAGVPALVESLVFAVLLGAFVAGFLALPLPFAGRSYLSLWTVMPPLATAGVAAFIGLLVLVAGAGLAFARRSGRYPPISADEEGLHTRVAVSSNSAHMVTLPWASIRAWGVLPAVPGSRRSTIYFAFSESQKLTWKEPEDARLAGRKVHEDRRTAYRERAQELHGLIATKTGLPLKMLAATDALTGVSASMLSQPPL